MATYKQRTPYQRPAAAYSDDEDPHTLLASGSTKHVSTAHSLAPAAHHHSNHHPLHQSTSAYEDDIVENTSDREWTSIRNSTASTRARQLQYQQQQQQQRTREWQFVLAQHHQHHHHRRPSLFPSGPTTSREISSDEYDDILSGTEAPSVTASPRIAAAAPGKTGASSAGEHPSLFGYSDLTSDGLESVGESEDLGVWSHDDEDAQSLTMSKPAARRRSSVLAASSTTTSLSHLPRPSFAPSPYNTRDADSKFQNQMPFHDGSGNFAGARSLRSNLESDIESSDRGWESSSSRASSMLRHYDPKAGHVRRKISSSEFKSVIQNIADHQHTGSLQSRRQRSRPRSVDGYSIASSSSQQPLFTYPNVVTRRPIFNIYESEMEEMADMVMEVPAKLGWIQTFEHVLRSLNPNEYEVHISDPTMMNPIKALAQHLTPDELAPIPTVEGPSSALESSATSDDKAQSTLESKSANQLEVQQVKQNMAAASLETMKRLQTRKRSNSHHRHTSDLMQVDFSPTVRERPMFENALHRDRGVISRSTGTSTSSNVRDTNLLTVFFSTLRRVQNHVKSNLLHADFYDEDRHAALTKSLGFDGDLGIEWSIGALETGREGATERERATSSATRDRRERRHERTPSSASSVSRSSSQQSVRRVNSDCGLESMRNYRNRDPMHSSRHRPSLVE
ncbi:hypothetical protein EDD21DRAFT_361000 [Dissophora ornata]|nr:hypothetical protein BGZ58_003646 [Dissophora ornata]KAI8606467.1 hypothetical protein EDD21DRAFT_361000 [Dissophora ornata]